MGGGPGSVSGPPLGKREGIVVTRGRLTKAFCLLTLVLVGFGCGNEKASWLGWKAKAPSTPGSAETLIGTQWDFGPNSVAFREDGKCLLAAQGGAVPIGEGAWTIADGVIRITLNDKELIKATWDGKTFVANGFVGSKVENEGANPQE